MWQFFSVRSFYYGVAIQSSAINVPPLSICKNERTKSFQSRNSGIRLDLFILISAYEGGVGHVYSRSRGRGQRKIFWGSAPDPKLFRPPNKNSWRRHCLFLKISMTMTHSTHKQTFQMTKTRYTRCVAEQNGARDILRSKFLAVCGQFLLRN